MVSARSVLSAAASVAVSAMLLRTIANDLMPNQIQGLLLSGLLKIIQRFSSQLTIIIEEYNGISVNELYEAAQTFLAYKISHSTARRLRVSKHDGQKDLSISMERGEEVVDAFQGVKLEWQFVRYENQKNESMSTGRYESRSFHLSFHKKHKEKVLQSYLPHVLTQSKAMRDENKTLKLHTVDIDFYGGWTSVNLNHPVTFSTVAMEEEAKRDLVEDLERFVRRKEFYRRVGKAWKRGYLLYGPPGTGKSSLIAAMANFLSFDVYDLELTAVSQNSDLRRLLIATANRSILIIEDIDCSVEFQDRGGAAAAAPAAEAEEGPNHRQENKVTLSGLLNFTDGLWSSCGDERIIVFTTNHKDKLDPALLRPGRMDVHIHMSYCGFSGFKTLARNYLGVDHHPLFEEIQQLIKEVEVTPAQVAEELMKSDDHDTAFPALVEFLLKKKTEDQEAKSKEESEHEGKGKDENEGNI